MEQQMYIEVTSLLERLNGYAARGQLKGFAFAATTADGNIVTGYGGSYSVSPTDGLMPLALLQLKMIEAVDAQRKRRRGDHPTLKMV